MRVDLGVIGGILALLLCNGLQRRLMELACTGKNQNNFEEKDGFFSHYFSQCELTYCNGSLKRLLGTIGLMQ